MLECFRLAHFRFRLLPQEPIFLPSSNKGNTLRSAFGSVFKRLTCIGYIWRRGPDMTEIKSCI